MKPLYAVLIGLAVLWLTRKLLPPGLTWLLGLLQPSEQKIADRVEAGRLLKQRAETEPDAALRLHQEYRRELKGIEGILNDGLLQEDEKVAAHRDELMKTRQAVLSEMQELERRMTTRGWMAPGTVTSGSSLFDRDTLLGDFLTAFLGGAVFGLIAVVPLGLMLLYGVYQHITGSPDAPSVLEMVGTPLTVFAGYALAALGTGLGLFMFRPLRRSWFGWMLSGSWIAASIYGGVGLAATLGWLWFGINIMDYDSPHEAWSLLLGMIGIMAVVGAPAGLYFRSQSDT